MERKKLSDQEIEMDYNGSVLDLNISVHVNCIGVHSVESGQGPARALC